MTAVEFQGGKVRAAHRVAKGTSNPHVAQATLDAIFAGSRLLVGREGAAFAYRIDGIPEDCRPWVLLVFEVEAGAVERRVWPPEGQVLFEFYALPGAVGGYVEIEILGVLNAPGYAPYTGPVSFVDTASLPALSPGFLRPDAAGVA